MAKPNVARIMEVLTYDAASGDLFWAIDKAQSRKRGSLASSAVNSDGYRHVKIDGYSTKAHHIAWVLYYGAWPERSIDHINGDRADNRIENLRLATLTQNNRNRRRNKSNQSGVKGVYKAKFSRSGKWHAQIHANGKRHHLGLFDRLEDAADAYAAASLRFHGDFGRV